LLLLLLLFAVVFNTRLKLNLWLTKNPEFSLPPT
jgi:hypothetical protein